MLNDIYSNEKQNKLKAYITRSSYGATYPISDSVTSLQFLAIVGRLYLLFFLIDHLDIDERVLLQNDEWRNYIIDLYHILPSMKEKIKLQHSSSQLDKFLLRIEQHITHINSSLGSLLLQERQRYNIAPTRNIITRGPNDSTRINLHNVMYSLRTNN